MKAIILGALALAAIPLGACTDQQVQQAQAVVAGVCAGAQAGSVLIAADGTIVGASTKAQTKIATGQQLVNVNCAAIGPAITSVANAMKANNATALVSVENEQASKMHIDPALLRKVVARYSK